MTAEAHAGFAGMGASLSTKAGMNGTSKSGSALSQSVSSEISSVASVGTTTTHTTECHPKEGETRSGIWQWVITTEDYSTSAFTAHTVCRTGDLAFVSPSCSYWDCNNGDCSECKSLTTDTDGAVDLEDQTELPDTVKE